MSATKALIIPPGAGPQHFVLGDILTVKIHGRETGGVYSQLETTCGPHVGPPLHIHHREDETFFVIEGEFEFVCAGERTTGGPGTIVRLPRGVPHRFKNLGKNIGRLLITLTPAGAEDFFAAVGALSPERQTDFPHIAELAARAGIEFVAEA
jgi:mannose-6-phosphate isomerase-like protein (cupin superfamily)